jgi:hypothetical protein
MRFLSLIRVNENSGLMLSAQLMQDMGTLMDDMTREGVLVRTAGLKPAKDGVRVRQRHGQLSMVDGPFVETKEVVGGFAIFEAPSLEIAIELTKRFLRVHGEEWDLECEVRPLASAELGCAAL